MEICHRCKSNNPVHITAVKTMTCITEVCGFCGRRGHTKDKCYSSPEGLAYRNTQQPKPAVAAIMTDIDFDKPRWTLKQDGRILGLRDVLLESGASICIMNNDLAL